MALALANMSGDVVMAEAGQYEMLLAASRESPRLRMIQPIQRADSDPVQRLLNAFQPGTYVRPHRHPSVGSSETVVLLQGESCRYCAECLACDGMSRARHSDRRV